jgi:hypothetical protein
MDKLSAVQSKSQMEVVFLRRREGLVEAPNYVQQVTLMERTRCLDIDSSQILDIGLVFSASCGNLPPRQARKKLPCDTRVPVNDRLIAGGHRETLEVGELFRQRTRQEIVVVVEKFDEAVVRGTKSNVARGGSTIRIGVQIPDSVVRNRGNDFGCVINASIVHDEHLTARFT